MSNYNLKGNNSINDTSDDNEKVRKPLLSNNGSPNILSDSSSPKSNAFSDDDEQKVILRLQNEITIKDSFGIIYMIFLLFGIAVLLPWNIFITAEDVF